ncbi:SusC/RagA family TonB-linked outer membrane protein [Terrimonas rubra]|uniref:SusC/RagA family TonB-linked outer membrane protein n=1 Tax=Terrimonas rubra TaxID=1035890 RepID=A0ABW6A8F5_9BACT
MYFVFKTACCRRLAACLLLFFSFSITLLAQTNEKITVWGKVISDSADLPLATVSVTVKGTSKGTVTNEAGAFELKDVDKNSRIVFSLIGYESKEMAASEIANGQSIKLNVYAASLEGVVVTGFQKIDKKKFTGSVVQVDKELINRAGYMDVSKMLQGTAAGVSVQNPSGTFGATPKIRIRGNASISANQEPLYVLNGVPISAPANVSVSQLYSGDPASLLSSVIAGLNANDIEDISILKDGSATALYGTRAANGIVSITTKKGSKGTLAINLSSAVSVGLKPDITRFNLMNSSQQIDLAYDLYNYGYLSVLNYPSGTGAFTDPFFRYAENKISKEQFNREVYDAKYANTNWFDVLFKNNVLQEHSLSLSGGGDKATYYLSGSFAGDNGAAVGYNNKRYTTDMRTIFNVSSKFLVDVDITANFRNQMTPGAFNSTVTNGAITRPFETNPSIYATTTSRAMSPYNSDGSYKYYRRNYAPFNIMEELKENFTKLDNQSISIVVKPSYKLTKQLTLETVMSFRRNTSQVDHVMTEYSNVAEAYRASYNDVIRGLNPYLFKDVTNPNSIPETILPRGGILDVFKNSGTELYGRFTLDYKVNFTDRHRVNLFGGFDARSGTNATSNVRGYGYMYYGGKIISPSQLAMTRAIQTDERYYNEDAIEERAVGGFVNGQYTFNNKYNFDFTLRADASNVFGSSVRSKYLPNYNVGVSWNVDREEFFRKLDKKNVIDHLTLRASYALRGNAYQTSPMLNARFYNAIRIDDVNSEIGIRVASPELYSLAWEKDYITNIGLDMSFLNRFSVIAEYYSRKNQDLIAPSSMPLEEGFTTKVINWASMSNKGFDFTFNVSNILNSKKFRWGAGLIYSYVKNEMVGGVLQSPLLTNVTKPDGYGKIGNPLYGLYAYNFAGLDANGQPLFSYGTGKGARTTNGILLSNTNDSLVSYMGPREPTTTGSISNTFGYGPFELRIFFTYSYGNKVFRSPMVQRNYADNLAVAQDIDARWRSSGDELITNVPGLVSSIQAAYLSSAGIQNEFAYNRSTAMVVNANVLRLNEVMLSYEVSPKALQRIGVIKSVRVMASANNIYYWADKRLRGVDPETLITGVSLPNPKSYSLRLIAQF